MTILKYSKSSHLFNFEQRRERLKQLIHRKAYQKGDFILASGKRSDYYIDARKITLDPEGAYLVGSLLFELLQREAMCAVGGLTLGADPIVSSIAVVSFMEKKPIPVFIVRKEIKEHGTQRVIEGIDLRPNQRVILVDDVLTTGGSLIEAAKKIKPLGVQVVKIMCIVDRREKRTPLLESLGCPVECLFSVEEIG